MTESLWINLSYDITENPFNVPGRASLHVGVCQTCSRVYRYEVPREPFYGQINGIWIPPSRRRVEEWRAERLRAIDELSEREKVDGNCAFQGDHTGAGLPDLSECQFPWNWRPGGDPDAFLRAHDLLGPYAPLSPKGPGIFIRDPSGRFDWRCRAGEVWTQWVSTGVQPAETISELNAAVDDGRVVEDVPGWFEDPRLQAPQRFFSGVEWTRWLSDGDRVWLPASRHQVDRGSDEILTKEEFARRLASRWSGNSTSGGRP